MLLLTCAATLSTADCQGNGAAASMLECAAHTCWHTLTRLSTAAVELFLVLVLFLVLAHHMRWLFMLEAATATGQARRGGACCPSAGPGIWGLLPPGKHGMCYRQTVISCCRSALRGQEAAVIQEDRGRMASASRRPRQRLVRCIHDEQRYMEGVAALRTASRVGTVTLEPRQLAMR